MAEKISFRQTAISHFPELTKKQKDVARWALDNEHFVAFASVTEVAQQAGVSTATVVRFCQALNYEGYRHLQAAIRQTFPRFATTIQRQEARLASPLPESDLLARVSAADINNIKRTVEMVEGEAFEASVTELDRATSILVVGEGLSAPAVLFLANSLKVMGFAIRAVTTGGDPLSLEVSTLRPGDLLVAMSLWRYSRETVEAMRWARETGTKRIAITDSEVSPLIQLADYAFVVSTYGIAHSSSPIAPISLINALVAALSFRRPQETLAALRKVDAARRSRLLEQ
jgi:DNA-binding MurR/RpiR family transcriptional regulator